jgi:hypothetical protein
MQGRPTFGEGDLGTFHNIHLTGIECKCRLSLHVSALPRTARAAGFPSRRLRSLENSPLSSMSKTLLLSAPSRSLSSGPSVVGLSCWQQTLSAIRNNPPALLLNRSRNSTLLIQSGGMRNSVCQRRNSSPALLRGGQTHEKAQQPMTGGDSHRGWTGPAGYFERTAGARHGANRSGATAAGEAAATDVRSGAACHGPDERGFGH